MTTLAFDCSTGVGSLALLHEDKLYAKELLEPGTQAAQLVSSIKELCAEAGCQVTDITEAFCPVGPGSFTGIRISLTVARILDFTTDATVKGVHTLDAFALSHDADNFTVATRAGKGEAYCQTYANREPQGEVTLVPLDDAKADIGNVENSTTHLKAPDMRVLAQMYERLTRTFPLEPIYVRAPDAEPAKPLGAK